MMWVFAGLFLVGAIYCGQVARLTWRDPDNWHIDQQTKAITFNCWAEFLLAMLMGVISAALMMLLVAS